MTIASFPPPSNDGRRSACLTMNNGTAGLPTAPRGALDASRVVQNESGRLYVPGRAYSLKVKVELRNVFWAMTEGLGRYPKI